MSARPQPLLVTGVPRSGTTWLARLLATAERTALAGREPMNPRGRQYALAGTVSGWVRLTELTPRQRRALRSTYTGRNPRTFGRYGRHQWRAPLPGTRIVVKDPFAMLSTPAIVAATGARAIQVYRHPGAVLASYRRMGWRPDLEELGGVLPLVADHHPELAERWDSGRAQLTEATGMALFWSILERVALDDAARTPGTLIVAHGELAAGGVTAVRALFDELGLEATDDTDRVMSGGDHPVAGSSTDLHRLDRRPEEVAESWRKHLEPGEVEEIEQIAGPTLAALDAARLNR